MAMASDNHIRGAQFIRADTFILHKDRGNQTLPPPSPPLTLILSIFFLKAFSKKNQATRMKIRRCKEGVPARTLADLCFNRWLIARTVLRVTLPPAGHGSGPEDG